MLMEMDFKIFGKHFSPEKKQTNEQINNNKKLPCSGGGKPTGANSAIPPSPTP